MVSCFACNNGTRGTDAVATFIALLHPNNLEGSWQTEKARKLTSTIRSHAPGVLEEFSSLGERRDEWLRRPDSRLLQRLVRVDADGPRVHAHLSVFGAKLGLYREHVGVALPLGAAVWSQFALNGGMTPEILNDRVKILPLRENAPARPQVSPGMVRAHKRNLLCAPAPQAPACRREPNRKGLP
jgi:hypothetical protein